jgi:hypothetical protein
LVDDGWNSKVGICPESRGDDLLNEV